MNKTSAPWLTVPLPEHLLYPTGGEPLAPADRQRVEQGLGRVLMAAVAGIDDRTVDLLRE